ncbi:MAG: DUF3501 family protein [Polyangiaceae bacterium]
MQLVERSEILKLSEYETLREHFRARVIAEKKARRVQLGDKISGVFESHDTVLLQIQEMLRTERISREAAIQHEIETYNQLVPLTNELSFTAMIEIDEREPREKFLVDATGIEKFFSVVVATPNGEERCAGKWDEARVLDDRASAVLYMKFPLTNAAADALKSGSAKATLVVDHMAYKARAEISQQTLVSLAEDLREG